MPGLQEGRVEESLAFLQKTSSKNGQSVFDHFVDVVQQILEERPNQAVDLLETSYLVKRSKGRSDSGYEIEPAQPFPVEDAKQGLKNLLGKPEVKLDAETGEPLEDAAVNEYECEDIMGNAALFSLVGAGLGESEVYRIALAARRLGEDAQHGVASLRFFGKFFGRAADYFVFEATLREPPATIGEAAEKDGIPVEQGTGPNAASYFVCTELASGPFTRLPDVRPGQIKVARRLKRFLTGCLDSEVSAYPVFPGKEAEYLRAQIARIAATTLVCPAGAFQASEEGALEKVEGFAAPPASELASIESWAHRSAHLKKQGRTVVWRKEPEEGAEEIPPTPEEAEEGPGALATLDKDASVEGGPAWGILRSSINPAVKHQVAGVRSNLWPGAYAVARGGVFASLYIGWGVKHAPFVPMPPPVPAEEYAQELLESVELPPKPQPPPVEEAEAGDGEDAE
ncbi:hypothetical protein WJX74_004503 [Apatococcus lobatus]|uniref:Uncharacterized protein n=2 Tax=Apatococcus TaxID=904362 RepID=A0AAW1T7D3_9CHLO